MNAEQFEPVAGTPVAGNPVAGNPEAPRSINPGETLKAARIQQGLGAVEVAATLRLPKKTLEHIESGQFERLPGDTFARGYVRTYARLLKLDPNRLVIEYDRYMGIEVREKAVNGISKVADYGGGGHSSKLFMRSGTTIVLLAIVASGLWWWYEGRAAEPVSMAVDTSEYVLEEVQVDSLAMPAAIRGVQTVAMQGGEELADKVAAFSASAVDAAAAESESQAAATEPAVAAAEPEAEPVAVAGTASSLRMSFNGNCWVQVSTTSGQVLHSALMRSGQSLDVEHDGPLELVIGAIETVAMVEYRGEPVNLASSNQSGVVRARLGQ